MTDKKNGRSRPPRNRGNFLFEFDMQRQASQDVRQYFIGDAYPPCTKSIDELQSIQLSDLLIDEHHRGKALFVRTVDEGVRAAAIQTVIEDETGAVERLAVYNAYALPEAADLMADETILAIKEPFFEASATGNLCIRVDHPSDLLFMAATDPRVPEKFREDQNDTKGSATEWKTTGNEYYKADKYTDAVRAFSTGINRCEPGDGRVKCDILRNRAIANTYLKRFEAALSDATAAVIESDARHDEQVSALNSKAHFRAGRAAYELRDFQEAKEQFAKALKLAPQDKDTARELQRTERRLEEQQTGNYDFSKMSELVSKRRNRMDHADFLSNTVKRDAGDHGRGLFAARDIKAGELVACEKAFAAAFDSDQALQDFSLLDSKSQRRLSGTQALMLFNAIAKMLHNPSKTDNLFDLYDGGYAFSMPSKVVDGLPTIDTFRAQTVLSYNTYGCPTVKTSSKAAQRQVKSESGYPSTGFWSTISYINHACNGNAMRAFIGDMMIVRATRDISKDEEILMPYRLPGPDNSVTQDELQKIWGFKCDCSLCVAEAKAPALQRRQRIQLSKECADLLSSNPASDGKTPTKKIVTRIEKLYGNTEKTYDGQIFERMPRIGLVAPGLWLCQAYASHKLWSKSADSALGVLQNLGIVVDVSNDSKIVSVERPFCSLTNDAVDAAMVAAWAYEKLTKTGLQKEMLDLAQSLYEILNGEMSGFEEKLNNWKETLSS